ncbi:MAG: hypothetical protein ACP5UV_03970 [Thermoplasmata archaeon]
MRQTMSLILMIFSIAASIFIISSGVSLQEQGLAGVYFSQEASIKNISESGSGYYAKISVNFINNGYVPVTMKFGNKTEALSGMSSTYSNASFMINLSKLISEGWLTKNVYMNVPVHERVFYYSFVKDYRISFEKIFDYYNLSTQKSYIIIKFDPSESINNTVITFQYGGIIKSVRAISGDNQTIKFQDPSQSVSLMLLADNISLNLD